tara:strand:+ start:28 stop:564 length:537 start_codon:yes stop_codon:yes gene_type:complete
MQFLFLRTLKVHLVLLLTSMVLFTAGCEDDDHDDHEEEGHTDADGFVLEDENGTQVYREFEGELTGGIVLAVGDTLELSVHFLDQDGEEIEHDEEGHDDDHGDDHGDEEAEIKVSGSDPSIAIVEAEGHEEGDDHEEEHGYGIHVIGVSSGSTSFKLELMHQGHADYTSTNNVPVTVN